MATFNITKRAFARERLTITNGAVKALTASVYSDSGNTDPAPNIGNKRRHASSAIILLEVGSGQIHFSEEGTAPTTGTAVTDVGRTASALDTIILESYEAIVKFKSIALTATNAIAEVVYYR